MAAFYDSYPLKSDATPVKGGGGGGRRRGFAGGAVFLPSLAPQVGQRREVGSASVDASAKRGCTHLRLHSQCSSALMTRRGFGGGGRWRRRDKVAAGAAPR